MKNPFSDLGVFQLVKEINKRAGKKDHRASLLDQLKAMDQQEVMQLISEVKHEIRVLWEEDPPLSRPHGKKLHRAHLLMELLP